MKRNEWVITLFPKCAMSFILSLAFQDFLEDEECHNTLTEYVSSTWSGS